MLLLCINQTCPKLLQIQRRKEGRGPLMCPVTPYFHKFIREWKWMLHHCHMTPGAAVPKVVWIFYKTGKTVSILGKRIKLWCEEGVGCHVSHGWLLKEKRRTFCYNKENQRFFFIKPKFLPQEAPANPSQNLCVSLSTVSMPACLNTAVRHVSPYLPSAFSSCSLCHPRDNSANLHFSWQNFFSLLLNLKWKWGLHNPNTAIKPGLERWAKSVFKRSLGKTGNGWLLHKSNTCW